MPVNIGQIHAKPIIPGRLTEQFVLHSPVTTPTLLVRTKGNAPNVVLTKGDYTNQQLHFITSAIQQLGTSVTKALLPEQEALVDGLCLIFDSLGQVDEILSDESAEVATFPLDNMVSFGQLPLDQIQVLHLDASRQFIQHIWPQIPNFLGFVLQVRTAYFAGPINASMLAPGPSRHNAGTAQTVAMLWGMFTTAHSGPDKSAVTYTTIAKDTDL